MRWTARALDTRQDADAVVALWDRALGEHWPVRPERLRAVIRAGYGVDADGRLAGAVCIDPKGSVPFLVVDRELHGHGIGSALNVAAVEHLGRLGLQGARLGAGGDEYVWPGIPRDLPEVEGFFFRRGWALEGLSGDLLLDLARYEPSREAVARATAAGVTFHLAGPEDAASVLAYEEREHPNWVRFFRRNLADDPRSVLFGRDRTGAVVAALLMELPPKRAPYWSRVLGADVAEIGCVGVAAARNGERIGTALMSVANAHVRDLGFRAAWVGYVTRFSFYERLGYRLWREYRMASRTL